jgi:hypothetical protein
LPPQPMWEFHCEASCSPLGFKLISKAERRFRMIQGLTSGVKWRASIVIAFKSSLVAMTAWSVSFQLGFHFPADCWEVDDRNDLPVTTLTQFSATMSLALTLDWRFLPLPCLTTPCVWRGQAIRWHLDSYHWWSFFCGLIALCSCL